MAAVEVMVPAAKDPKEQPPGRVEAVPPCPPTCPTPAAARRPCGDRSRPRRDSPVDKARTVADLATTITPNRCLAAFDQRACRRPFDLDRTRARTAAPARRWRTALNKLQGYVDGQGAHLVNYHRRQRAGLPIDTPTTEGLANALVNCRMNTSQRVRWSARGVRAVLANRTVDGDAAIPKAGALQLAA